MLSLPDPGSQLDDEERKRTQIAFIFFSSISFLCSLFVVITYSIFPEKRKSNIGVYVLFQAIFACVMSFFFILTNAYGDQLEFDEFACRFQYWGITFAGNCIIYSWMCITVNIYYLVTGYTQVQLHWLIFTPLILIVSLACSTLSAVLGPVTYHTWCLITANHTGWYLFSLQGGLTICSIIGSVLWFLSLRKMRSSLRREKESLLRSESINDPNNYELKKGLLMRQMIYIGGFLLMNIVEIVKGIRIVFNGITLYIWVTQGIALFLIGIYIFIVFGLTKRNILLWKSICFRIPVPEI